MTALRGVFGRVLVCLPLLALSLQAQAGARSGTLYQIHKDEVSVASGGSASGSFRLQSTVGQPTPPGRMHSTLYILWSGINTTPDTDGDNSPDDFDIDDDNDGFTDVLDAFPIDPHEWLDTDGDGTGNNGDLDDDNDGVPDEFDAFPLDPTRSEAPDDDLMDMVIQIFKVIRDRRQVQ